MWFDVNPAVNWEAEVLSRRNVVKNGAVEYFGSRDTRSGRLTYWNKTMGIMMMMMIPTSY
jgi:hypothetical protein